MKKVIIGIFAHPDDEAFGPSGTLMLEKDANADIHLFTLTAGEAGENPDSLHNLGETRLKEWRAAGELIGATSMHHLGYKDGTLSNLSLLEAAGTVEASIRKLLDTYDDNTEIDFMCFDLNGISGHIDHIVASRLACLVFYRLRAIDKRLKRLRLFCIPQEAAPSMNTQWLFMEPGRTHSEIHEIIDATALSERITEVIRCHKTQRGDGEGHIERLGDRLGMNYFLIKD